jgi:N-acetylneuraminic acid mutarotase
MDKLAGPTLLTFGRMLLVFFLLLLAGKIFSQTNQWTWVHGNTSAGVSGVYGTKGVAATANKPGARRGSIGWTDAAGGVWVFGGVRSPASGGGYFNDLWKYNTQTNEFTWIGGDSTAPGYAVYGIKGVASPANQPGGRTGSAVWTDASHHLWLFGGVGVTPAGTGMLNDLWKYNINTNEWTWVAGDSTGNNMGVYGTMGTASFTNKPGGRQSCIGWKDAAGHFWLFGGLGFATRNPAWFLNDLWKYDPASNAWTWVKGDTTFNPSGVYGTPGVPAPENRPAGRKVTASWTDQAGNFWLFGGDRSTFSILTDFTNDLWKYNVNTNEWTWLRGNTHLNAGQYGTRGQASPTNEPGSRKESTSWIDTAGNLWLFGGYGRSASAIGWLNDLWKYNITANQWTWVKGDNTPDVPGVYGTRLTPAAANKPGARAGSVALTDNNGHFGLLGGNTALDNSTITDPNMNDLWIFSPATNENPVVTITSPVTGSTYNAGNNITVHADATDVDGHIQRVEFYANGYKFGADSTSPYQYAAQQVEGGNYIVTVRAFDDQGDSTLSAPVSVTVKKYRGNGKITAEGYGNIPGTSITDLTSHPSFPDSPTLRTQLSQLQYGSLGDHYGVRLRGYLVPSHTSDYIIAVTSDDQSEVWLSTDDNPVNKRKIAYLEHPTDFIRGWYWYPSQRSQRIRLIAGGKYYLEILHKQGTGNNHLSIGWEWSGYPNDTLRFFSAPVNGPYILPYDTTIATVLFKSTNISKPAANVVAPVIENDLGLTVQASPNPSAASFNLVTRSNRPENITVTVMDVMGRVIERLQAPANGSMQFGSGLRPGLYYIDVMQGKDKQRLKLVKQ